jgi:polar amino acid transport system ATP-binding protein
VSPISFLEIEGLRKSYGTNEVLRGIDLSVEQHEVVCLIGASGCGKSTLLRCINALETIGAGHVRLDGDVVSGEGTDVDRLRRDVGIVFQAFNLFPHMRVLDNITLGPRRIHKQSRAEAEAQALVLLERVGLAAKAGAYPDQLSGGQQQRVAIVRALAMNPRVLLLDEITSALDPELVAEVLGIVRDLAAEGMTMLLATHEMSFAREVAHTVCFLHEGVILEQGPPEQIFGAPTEPRTQAFLHRIVEAGRL